MSSTHLRPMPVSVWQGEPWFWMTREVNVAGDYVTRASLASVTIKVFDDSSSAKTVTLSQTLTISAVIFDTLQTADDRWDEDDVGYNFAYLVPGSAFPLGARQYRVEVVFTDTSSPARITARVATVITGDLLGTAES